MSKKDFIALADAMKESKPRGYKNGDYYSISGSFDQEMEQWRKDVSAIADVCSRQNSNFNRQRWLDYIAGECGPSGGKIKG